MLESIERGCANLAQDERARAILRNLLAPLEAEISDGTFDKPVAMAILRVTAPLSVLMLLVLAVCIAQTAVGLRVLARLAEK